MENAQVIDAALGELRAKLQRLRDDPRNRLREVDVRSVIGGAGQSTYNAINLESQKNLSRFFFRELGRQGLWNDATLRPLDPLYRFNPDLKLPVNVPSRDGTAFIMDHLSAERAKGSHSKPVVNGNLVILCTRPKKAQWCLWGVGEVTDVLKPEEIETVEAGLRAAPASWSAYQQEVFQSNRHRHHWNRIVVINFDTTRALKASGVLSDAFDKFLADAAARPVTHKTSAPKRPRSAHNDELEENKLKTARRQRNRLNVTYKEDDEDDEDDEEEQEQEQEQDSSKLSDDDEYPIVGIRKHKELSDGSFSFQVVWEDYTGPDDKLWISASSLIKTAPAIYCTYMENLWKNEV